MLNLPEKDWIILNRILSQYPYTFYAFGSRVKNTSKKFSDLDLCFKEKVSGRIISKIMGELEDSDLPIKVDLIYWGDCSDNFKKQIENDLVCIQKKI